MEQQMKVELQHFKFDRFTLRSAREGDAALAKQWTEADPDHRTYDPKFWLEMCPGAESYLLVDVAGPVFFFKMVRIDARQDVTLGTLGIGLKPEKAAELHIQFAPGDRQGTRLRSMLGMDKGWKWLEKMLAEKGFDAVYFTSRSPRLILFCEKRLGFAEVGEMADGQTRLKAYVIKG
jgi:hypothetical protein